MCDGVSVLWVGVRGPLPEYAVGFAGFLESQGYVVGSVRLQMHLVAQLSRWLDAEGLDVSGLTELVAERFVAARRARIDRLFRSRRALEPVMGYLRGLGAAPVPVIESLSPVDEVVERYRRYLLVEHADPAATYWYLSAVPELLALAAQRLETYLAEAER